MSFLSRLRSLFGELSRKDIAQEPPQQSADSSGEEPSAVQGEAEVAEDETLSRFILNKRWISKKDGRVFGDAFMPHPTERPWQTSVYRVGALTEEERWGLGERVRGARPESLKGRADVTANAVISVKPLRTVPTHVGEAAPLLHVDIEGWPDDPEAQRMLATQLAEAAQLIRLPSAS